MDVKVTEDDCDLLGTSDRLTELDTLFVYDALAVKVNSRLSEVLASLVRLTDEVIVVSEDGVNVLVTDFDRLPASEMEWETDLEG